MTEQTTAAYFETFSHIYSERSQQFVLPEVMKDSHT